MPDDVQQLARRVVTVGCLFTCRFTVLLVCFECMSSSCSDAHLNFLVVLRQGWFVAHNLALPVTNPAQQNINFSWNSSNFGMKGMWPESRTFNLAFRSVIRSEIRWWVPHLTRYRYCTGLLYENLSVHCKCSLPVQYHGCNDTVTYTPSYRLERLDDFSYGIFDLRVTCHNLGTVH